MSLICKKFPCSFLNCNWVNFKRVVPLRQDKILWCLNKTQLFALSQHFRNPCVYIGLIRFQWSVAVSGFLVFLFLYNVQCELSTLQVFSSHFHTSVEGRMMSLPVVNTTVGWKIYIPWTINENWSRCQTRLGLKLMTVIRYSWNGGSFFAMNSHLNRLYFLATLKNNLFSS